jgi:hypothetical protein
MRSLAMRHNESDAPFVAGAGMPECPPSPGAGKEGTMSELKERIEKAIDNAVQYNLGRRPSLRDEIVKSVAEAVMNIINTPAPKHSPLPWGGVDANGDALAVIKDSAGEHVGHTYKGKGQPAEANRDLILKAVNAHEQAVRLARMVFDWMPSGRNMSIDDFRIKYELANSAACERLMTDTAKAILRSAGEVDQ